MIRIKRKAIMAEINAAVAVGAACDQWAASAAQRLGKLSQDFPDEAPCCEMFPFHGDPDDSPEFDRILPPDWWLLPAVIIGTGIAGIVLWSLVTAIF